jgi:predicted nucleic acid-binding protein
MRVVLIDTLYWIARINPKDQWHQRAVEVAATLDPFRGVTTEAVLIEVANYFCAFGPMVREMVAGVMSDILEDPTIEVVPQTREVLQAGMALYADRLDKSYSLTDCISMIVLQERGLTEVLTHDRHFAQEGFNVLL